MTALFARVSGAVSTIGAALTWALVPKCPLCVAAWLAAAGVGAQTAAVLAPLLRPVALSLLAVATLALVLAIRSRSRRRCCSSSTASGQKVGGSDRRRVRSEPRDPCAARAVFRPGAARQVR